MYQDIWTKSDHWLNFIPYSTVSNHPESTIPVFNVSANFSMKNWPMRILGGLFGTSLGNRLCKKVKIDRFLSIFFQSLPYLSILLEFPVCGILLLFQWFFRCAPLWRILASILLDLTPNVELIHFPNFLDKFCPSLYFYIVSMLRLLNNIFLQG